MLNFSAYIQMDLAITTIHTTFCARRIISFQEWFSTKRSSKGSETEQFPSNPSTMELEWNFENRFKMGIGNDKGFSFVCHIEMKQNMCRAKQWTSAHFLLLILFD